jgi:hypothetical protein
VDFNENGVDDYTDILLGARKMGKTTPNMTAAIAAAWEI